MKRKISKIGRRGIVAILAIVISISMIASATLLPHVGELNTTINVERALILDDHDWNVPIVETFTVKPGCEHCIEHEFINDGCQGVWLDWTHEGLPDLEGIDITMTEYIPGTQCLDLPEEWILGTFQHWGSDAYFDVTLEEIPEGYDIINGIYNGWCVDTGDNMPQGIPLDIKLWCVNDLEQPWQDDDWDCVTWMLNNRGELTPQQFQYAVWYFIDGGYTGDDPDVLAIIADAESLGEDFIPECGDTVPILCDAGDDIQYTFIEAVIIGCGGCGEVMELPFYVEAGETLEFCLCYEMDSFLMPIEYQVTSKLIKGVI